MSTIFRISEIYETIMGESTACGLPCSIIRMGGCNLRCSYCDSAYTMTDYKEMALDMIVERIGFPYPSNVLVTGGEPLIQNDTPRLLEVLIGLGYKVYIETNGSLDVSGINPEAIKIVDLKCPSSGESHMNHFKNLDYLADHDEVKFVIGNEEDFMWAADIVRGNEVFKRVTSLFSPVYKKMDSKILASWILRERLDVRLQLQMHKIIWGDRRGV